MKILQRKQYSLHKLVDTTTASGYSYQIRRGETILEIFASMQSAIDFLDKIEA